MSKLRIREASSKDLQRVYEIEKESFKDAYSPNFLNFLLDVNNRTFLVAEKDGVVVGYIIASADKNLGHIIAIAVHPSERRRAVGKALIGEIFKILEAVGATEIRLEVRKSNVIAKKFYEFLGFKPSHSVKNYYGDEDALVYLKLI